jgi:cation:H+ antiporter
VTLLFLILGVAGLYYGAEWLVVGASRIALSLNVAPLVIGLTVVAFGTSMPEMLTGAQAAWTGSTDIALGNVVGSNIANLGLILGLSALIRAIPISREIFKLELPLMLLASVFVYGLAATGVISRFWGVVLLAGLVGFTWATLRSARREPDTVGVTDVGGVELDPAAEVRMGMEIARATAGLIALVVGAKLLVDAAVVVARDFGVPEFLIAASMVALGTSLPELATSMVAAMRGEADVLVGNIVGSNVFNLLGGLGIAAAIEPVPVSQAVLSFDLPVMLVITAAATIALYTYGRIQRWEGGVLLLAYGAYMVALFA